MKAVKTAKGAKRDKGKNKTRVVRKRQPGVPPPESNVWPEEYRGENWKPAFAVLFAGRCQLCAYSCPLPKSRQMLDKWRGETQLLLCTNHPASPGELCEVLPTDTCRNFKAKSWKPPRLKPAQDAPVPVTCPCGRGVRRIPVGQGLFALVDAADYKKLSKYKWYAKRHTGTIYATSIIRGRVVYMHRMIRRPRKGYVVDHIDGNGLNNRRCNLRVCTHQQNQANRGSRGGSSRFVGVHQYQGKWEAGIRCRGKYYYCGLFDDEVEAAKARDRKAYALNGEHAYLNLPEELRRWIREHPGAARSLRRRK